MIFKSVNNLNYEKATNFKSYSTPVSYSIFMFM